jgi:hypothetical protein
LGVSTVYIYKQRYEDRGNTRLNWKDQQTYRVTGDRRTQQTDETAKYCLKVAWKYSVMNISRECYLE